MSYLYSICVAECQLQKLLSPSLCVSSTDLSFSVLANVKSGIHMLKFWVTVHCMDCWHHQLIKLHYFISMIYLINTSKQDLLCYILLYHLTGSYSQLCGSSNKSMHFRNYTLC